MTDRLNYKVQCKPPGQAFWETIAAFNVCEAALGYANRCMGSHSSIWSYRVQVNGRTLATYGAEASKVQA